MTLGLRCLLLDHRWRSLVGRLRFIWLKTFYGIRTSESAHARQNTVSHNLTALDHIAGDFTMPRMSRLIHGLLAVEGLRPDSRILVIGPRTENDLLVLRGHGFRDVTGVDLISYSPWIVLGDMHALPFDPDSFDAVLCGWTLSYSTDPKLACSEMIRVVRHGGYVAIGVEHATREGYENLKELRRRDPRLVRDDDREYRINDTAAILELLKPALGQCFVNIDAPLRALSADDLQRTTGLASSQCIVVAGINKSATRVADGSPCGEQGLHYGS